jgi:hypothetical protein
MAAKARSRYFSMELMNKGFGLFILEARDFPRSERDRLFSEIVTTFEKGALSGEVLDLARRLANALQAPCATQEALRWHLQADGRELVAKVRQVASVVPAVHLLGDWL